ncbi:TadE/TadG family type IV pilus assembly protein [Actinosynnema sp. CS-041913]|uniref:TadE/TadG family type IV pilus assembly protein n=1 Tax=Actinosynnema sp. CS-041913 TaxID=3239917 RepID=UPI003D925686
MPRRPSRPRTPTTRERLHRTRVPAALRRLRTDQRGAGTVELVIATPLLLLLILLIAQFALYMHATHIAQAAASEALSAARVYGGSATAGNTEGQRILTQLGSGPLQETSVDVQRGPAQAFVTITGTVINVIPFATFTVHAEAVGPVDKFTPPTSTGAVSP